MQEILHPKRAVAAMTRVLQEHWRFKNGGSPPALDALENPAVAATTPALHSKLSMQRLPVARECRFHVRGVQRPLTGWASAERCVACWAAPTYASALSWPRSHA